MCVGSHFALLKAQLVLATWLQVRELRLVAPGRCPPSCCVSEGRLAAA